MSTSSNSLSKFAPWLALSLVIGMGALTLWLLSDLRLDWAALRHGDWRALAASFESVAQTADMSRVLLLLALMALLPLSMLVPMSGLCLATGLLLPVPMAIPTILLGLACNTVLAHSLTRVIGGAALGERLRGKLAALDFFREGARRHAWRSVILARYLPIPFAMPPVAAAIFGIGLLPVTLGTVLGMLPQTLVYVTVAKAGRDGDIKTLGLALAGVAGLLLLTWILRNRLSPRDAHGRAPVPLVPQSPALGPVLIFYSIPGHELCDDARQELWDLRPRLGFEVQEQSLQPDSPLEAQYHDHVPLVFLGSEKLFNFQVDANVLAKRLQAARADQTRDA